MEDDECILDECRFVDENHRWGYAVICVRESHYDRECPREHVMFYLDEVR